MSYLFLILAILLAPISYAKTSREVKLLVEKTFARDNTFCNFKNKTVEISIRGEGRYTEKRESPYGQIVLQKVKNNYTLLPVNKERFGRYKLLRGQSKICSKSVGVELNPQTSAILFLKENHPFKEKLTIQLYDTQLAEPKDVIETDYLTDKVELAPDGFHFRSLTERLERQIGKVTIAGNEYIFQDQDMSPWIGYSARGFETLASETYKKSPWKKFFQDETDFFMFTGWNPEEKKFNNPYVYTAINHKIKRECVLFSSGPHKKLNGSEFWRCKGN